MLRVHPWSPYAETPLVHSSYIRGQSSIVVQKQRKTIELPPLYQREFAHFDVRSLKGILLYGTLGVATLLVIADVSDATKVTHSSISSAYM